MPESPAQDLMKFKSLCSTLLGLFSTLALLSACGGKDAALALEKRIVALGDIHGDLDATRRALRLAGVIDAQDHWTGGRTEVVQTGDQLDRGDQELELLNFLEKLGPEAEAAGGKLHILNGNHEIMNAQGDFRFVTPKGFESFAALKLPVPPATQALLKNAPLFVQGRAAAFLPGGVYALKLAQRPAVLQLGKIVFVHGGLHPEHVDYGLEKLNLEYQDWLRGQTATLPELLSSDSSPIWSRVYSDPSLEPDCARLSQTLTKLGAERMVVGHSVQPRVSSACNGQVWRIDVGMSRLYGGPVQALEIQGEHWRVLEEKS
ncbi:calcineurin [bacterium (Candidatus Blackallbacteria) CG17_big_fil_post_rev_8_21_14_2_50_48_46]|uniref:Calcineurin n=1 Tax=bacterium (Candidatus Blackallbacteria) CG17_big_fil_post_rev_8_21_14_2_50_48_46 TaxID=2014261 RepID=A0A2M7GBM9_9BACT|nr:MAG: calcineurin [bacterium (Candidatus Blackallbacteria) CG18_big_fil_WC_8_21_14_2_50_49_26]PIW19598.1 MAG: calcineurin [bacterium (Candidatus Blackallbacteria) CG17_big_fil_post_rev_8_21_14_2_50_48_46]PIW47670.1 MAG: calcineurin [bacterium (Candidatus Blackallbacteria) CG13_big_fil_rev_8_21_14_2_50_49_14]